MKRLVATLFAFLLASAAHAQSGLLQANQVWAGPPSGGQGFARARALVAADLPAIAAGSLSLASGQILVGQVSGFAGAVAMSGDCTIVASGAIVCTKTNGVAFGALATTAPGTGVATALGTAVGSAGSVVVNGGALGTPASGVGTNLTALNAANITSGTLPNARIVALPNANLASSTMTIAGKSVALGGTYAPARAGAAGGSPGAGTATTGMAGLNLTFTPNGSGNMLFTATLVLSNNTASDGCTFNFAFGTGTAPAHNAASTGTGFGVAGVYNGFGAAGMAVTVPLTGYQTGFTLGTTYWIDVLYGASIGGTCAINAYSIQAMEQ